MDEQAILMCNEVTKSFKSGEEVVHAVRGVSLTLVAGQSCAVVGPSGSGKSTLLSLAAGLESPTSGTVGLAGAQLSALSEDDRAEHRGRVAGFVFQNYLLFPTMTALENVLLPLEILGAADRERAVQILGRVGLSKRLHHYPHQLSGGEQQRVAVARAFVHEPAVLFADEPTGNLDRANAQMVIELLLELQRTRGTSLLLVTHDRDIAGRLQRVVEMRDGEVADDA